MWKPIKLPRETEQAIPAYAKNSWNLKREFKIRPGMLRVGRNTIAVRCFDQFEGGDFNASYRKQYKSNSPSPPCDLRPTSKASVPTTNSGMTMSTINVGSVAILILKTHNFRHEICVRWAFALRIISFVLFMQARGRIYFQIQHSRPN